MDPYTAVLDGGQQIDVESHRIEIMVDPYRITVDQIIEKLKENITWGSNQQAYLRWWHFKKEYFIEIAEDEDLMQVLRRKKVSKKVLFLVAISNVVEDDDIAEDLKKTF